MAEKRRRGNIEDSNHIKTTNENTRNKKSSRKISRKIKKKKILLLNILLILFTILFIYSCYKIILWVKENNSSKKLHNETIETVDITEEQGDVVVVEQNPPTDTNDNYVSDYYYYMSVPFLSVNFDELINKNNDTVAWIKVNGTDVNYPVVQTTDNSYYLTHAFDKSYNSSGWIFADYRCNMDEFRDNTIIYGHNRLNNTLFGTLLNATKKSWCDNKENRIINLSTKTKNTLWQIFSVYTIDKESKYLNVYFKDSNSYQSYLDTIKNRSTYDFGVPLTTKDKILTLSTCSNNTKYRVVIHAKLIKSTEK